MLDSFGIECAILVLHIGSYSELAGCSLMLFLTTIVFIWGVVIDRYMLVNGNRSCFMVPVISNAHEHIL